MGHHIEIQTHQMAEILTIHSMDIWEMQMLMVTHFVAVSHKDSNFQKLCTIK